jgi:hypothetical protein
MNFAAGMQIGGQDATFGGMRNRVINGAMNIAQRNTSVSGITSTYDSYPAIDRFLHYQETTSAVCTVAQVADAPAGFVNSLKITVTTADASVAAGDRINIAHKIEGLNLLDFDFGLSTAKSFTVSFWVKSSVTGTYALEIYNYGISTASTATKTYTINSANTWEYKTVTFTGDTVYPHVKTNGASLAVWMWLMAGSNYNSTNGGGVFTAVGSGTQRAYGQTANIAATVNNTFQMTGMQLETGSAASAFENRQYGTELQLCQRYYYKSLSQGNSSQHFNIVGRISSTTQSIFTMNLPVDMRTSPSVAANPVYNTGSGWQSNLAGVDNRAWSSAPTQLSPQLNQAVFYASTTAWGSQYIGMVVQPFTPTGASANFLEISAEL